MEIINKEVYAGKEFINVGVDINGERFVRVTVIRNYDLDIGSKEIESVEMTDDFDSPKDEQEEKEIIEFVKNNLK